MSIVFREYPLGFTRSLVAFSVFKSHLRTAFPRMSRAPRGFHIWRRAARRRVPSDPLARGEQTPHFAGDCWSSDALRLSSSDPTGRKSRALSIVVAEYRREVRKLPYSGNRAGRRLRSRDSEAHRRKTRAAAEQGSGYNLSASAYGTTTAVCS